MRRAAGRWRMGVLCLLFLMAMSRPVDATGPYDGIWFVTQHCPSAGFLGTIVVSITENDATATYFGATFNTVLFVLNSSTESWNVDLGTRICSTMEGQIFTPDGTAVGTFTVTFPNPTSVNGTAQVDGYSCSLTGTRVF